jgi:hypothetical protein
MRPIHAIQSAAPVVMSSASKILEGNVFLTWKNDITNTINTSKVQLFSLKNDSNIHDQSYWDICSTFFEVILDSYMNSISEYEIIQRTIESDIEFLFRVSSYTLIVDVIFSLAIVYKELKDLRKSKVSEFASEAPTQPAQSNLEM